MERHSGHSTTPSLIQFQKYPLIYSEITRKCHPTTPILPLPRSPPVPLHGLVTDFSRPRAPRGRNKRRGGGSPAAAAQVPPRLSPFHLFLLPSLPFPVSPILTSFYWCRPRRRRMGGIGLRRTAVEAQGYGSARPQHPSAPHTVYPPRTLKIFPTNFLWDRLIWVGLITWYYAMNKSEITRSEKLVI